MGAQVAEEVNVRPAAKDEPGQGAAGDDEPLVHFARCKVVWLLFGAHLYPCADVSGLLLPGQM